MPLSFESLSHGKVAFGFFNIESDMLLLDRLFFFATEFCDLVGRLAQPVRGGGTDDILWKIRSIDDPRRIGDLMGAIHGVRFSGFIGEVYRRHPFPGRRQDFKQNPDGNATQAEICGLIKPYATPAEVKVAVDADGSRIDLGSYLFERSEFHRMLDYVWLGGYPRWKKGGPPDYIAAMRRQSLHSTAPLFDGIRFNL